MNIDVLERIIKNRSDYFIGVSRGENYLSGHEWETTYLFSTPSSVLQLIPKGTLNEDNTYTIIDIDISLSILKKIDSTYVETNIPLSKNYTPFQLGVRISNFDDVFELKDNNVNEFLFEVFRLRKEGKLKDYKFWDYIKLYKEVSGIK